MIISLETRKRTTGGTRFITRVSMFDGVKICAPRTNGSRRNNSSLIAISGSPARFKLAKPVSDDCEMSIFGVCCSSMAVDLLGGDPTQDTPYET